MKNQNLFGSKRRTFLKNKIFYIFLVIIAIFGWWINQPADYIAPPEGIITNAVTRANEAESDKIGENNDFSLEERENTVVSQGGDAYYLLKEIDGEIRLFHYDDRGKEKFIKVTDIPFSLISYKDQEEFSKGIILTTEAELDAILQDFES